MNPASPDVVEQLISRIEHEARTNPGVETYEDLLLELLNAMESAPDQRGHCITRLVSLVDEWPWGAVEILEFTMRRLQWPEVQEALHRSAASDPNFRHRELAKRALEVFEDEWDNGDIYRTYREEEKHECSGD